ncbi:unnamed protein product [Coffea canephora]|uniref:DH200=94 genomic scaffold, scaffold_1399 n=1 Tax=Coffea canephora TaxID=49390 RepID=A0A068VIZ2_COFCA|nr:unnamed protein product [Coffea canephora]
MAIFLFPITLYFPDNQSDSFRLKGSSIYLGKLSGDECWSIIKGKVMSAGKEVVLGTLISIAADRIGMVRGFKADLIGGLLHTNRREKWHSIVQESLLNDQSQINQILKVSFDHLSSPSVKKCFAYCSIFPQDTELGEDELIEHWVAEGFVLPDRENTGMMEERGGEYLRILLQSSLLEKVGDEGSTWGTYYKMHDLVHDFAKSILNPESSSQDRYLALNSSEGLAENTTRTIPASIRTLFLHLEGGISVDMLLRFKYLHVLRLYGDDVKFLPSSIGKLPSLLLLDIKSSRIRSLPESLCKLYNLQTLTMRDDALEGGFPKRMSDLISLRHLNYHHGDAELKMPVQMGLLTCLQTLKFFNVSQEKGRGIEELGTLKYLKGSLEIRNLGLVKGKEAANQAKLFEKPDLSRLVFEWKRGDRNNCEEDVLEGLQPHPNLQKLEIDSFMGNKFPQWIINLPKLVTLWIENCHRCSELPSLGQLPSLKRLYLNRLYLIRSVGDEFYASGSSTRRQKFFPALEELCVEHMGNLVEWEGLTTISDKMFQSCRSLRSLSVERCPNLVSFSLNLQETPSLEEFGLVDCPKLIPHSFKGFAFATSLRRLSINSPFSSDDSPVDDFDWLASHGVPATPASILDYPHFTKSSQLWRNRSATGLDWKPCVP